MTIAIRPSSGTRRRGYSGYRSDLGKNGTGIFLQRGLDSRSNEQPVGQITHGPSLRAKRSNPFRKERMDCFVASLLAMTWNSKYNSEIPRRATPELLREFVAPQRARGMPGARCTRSLVCSVLVAHECSHHGRTGTPGIPARNGFNGFLRALVSSKSARMCERAVLTNRPSLDLSPFVLKGRKSLTGSVGQIRCLPQPEQLHGL